MLKPQDILVLTRLLISKKRQVAMSYPNLSQSTGLSASESHAAVKRAAQVGLLVRPLGEDASSFAWQPSFPAIQEFLFHGLKYVFPLEMGTSQRGVSTGLGTPGLNEGDRGVYEGETWVWPCAEGKERGVAITPLYRSVPLAAIGDSELHKSLASLDLIRSSNHRLRKLGESWWLDNLLRS